MAGKLPDRAAQIMRQAPVTYTTTFLWPCSEMTWAAVIDNPLMMGELWVAYGFAPTYEVSVNSGVIEVEDPTGLSGKVRAFRGGSGERIYLADGLVDHWAVPFFNSGEAVFVLKKEREDGGVRGHLSVYVRSTNFVANAVLKLGESILLEHIDNRITLNLQDARTIVEAIESAPGSVVAKLTRQQAERFESLLPQGE